MRRETRDWKTDLPAGENPVVCRLGDDPQPLAVDDPEPWLAVAVCAAGQAARNGRGSIAGLDRAAHKGLGDCVERRRRHRDCDHPDSDKLKRHGFVAWVKADEHKVRTTDQSAICAEELLNRCWLTVRNSNQPCLSFSDAAVESNRPLTAQLDLRLHRQHSHMEGRWCARRR